MRLFEFSTLTEGLIRSIDRPTLIKIIRRTFPDIQIKNWEEYSGYELFIALRNVKHADVEPLLNTLGWYVSNKGSDEWIIEPKYDIDVTSKIPNNIFHVTPLKNVGKIQKIGLVPRAEKKLAYHPDRIYFALTKKDAYDISRQLTRRDNQRNLFQDYAILALTVDKLSNNVKFYADPNFYGKGVYTVSNSPPHALQIVETF